MIGQNSLRNFYISVQFTHPMLAVLMQDNVIAVAVNSLSEDKSGGQKAADALRQQAEHLPEIQRRVLEIALTDLGY